MSDSSLGGDASEQSNPEGMYRNGEIYDDVLFLTAITTITTATIADRSTMCWICPASLN